MNKTIRNFSAAFMLSASIASTSLLAPSVAMSQEINKEAIEQIIRSYLLENPEIMLEVQAALEAKQVELRAAQQAKTLTEMNDEIYNSKNQMIIGDPNAKITLVEFFDYNCGYCKRAMDDMNLIVQENPDVKFIMKEFPVLGEASIQASRISIALNAKYPELYDQFHRELLSFQGPKDGSRALQIASALGADENVLKEALEGPEVSNTIQEAYKIADGLGISGTPSYIVGEDVIFGAVGYDSLAPRVANMRKCGASSCG